MGSKSAKRIAEKYVKAINKRPIVILISKYNELVSNEYIYESEQLFILHYRELGNNLLNLNDGGPGNIGYKPTEKTRQKMCIAAQKRGPRLELLASVKSRIIPDKDGKRFCKLHNDWLPIENFKRLSPTERRTYKCKECHNKNRKSRAKSYSRRKI